MESTQVKEYQLHQVNGLAIGLAAGLVARSH